MPFFQLNGNFSCSLAVLYRTMRTLINFLIKYAFINIMKVKAARTGRRDFTVRYAVLGRTSFYLNIVILFSAQA